MGDAETKDSASVFFVDGYVLLAEDKKKKKVFSITSQILTKYYNHRI